MQWIEPARVHCASRRPDQSDRSWRAHRDGIDCFPSSRRIEAQGSGYAGVHSLANLQNIGCGHACSRHKLAAADLFHSCAAVDGHDGYVVPRCSPLFKADNATLSFYATKEGKISVSYQGWDQSKIVLAGQQFVVTWGQGHVEARIVERRQ